jgi:hypothetical protein
MSGESVVYDEPAGWIVEQARHQGVTLSRRQLADWHRAGLIPEPDRNYLGGRDGTESIYPSGGLRQAIACSTLMKQFGSVERVGWELWVRAFPVAERFWREPLSEAHQMFRLAHSFATNDRSAGGSPELSDAADEFIETAGDLPEAPRRMGVARRRLRRTAFKELLGIIISTAIGAFKLTEGSARESADPKRLLSRLLGTQAGRHKAAMPHSQLLSVTGQAVGENLEAMAAFLPLIATTFSPDAINETELASAKDELVFLLQAYLSLRQKEDRVVPGSTPDLAVIKQVFEDLAPKEQAAALLIWLAVRNIPGWRENLNAIRQGVLVELGKGNHGNGSLSPIDDLEWADRSRQWHQSRKAHKDRRLKRRRSRDALILAGHGVSLRVEAGTLLVRNGFTHYPQKQETYRFFKADPNLPRASSCWTAAAASPSTC